jgi:hypothetical protein
MGKSPKKMRKCSNKKNDFDSIVGPCLERLLKIRLLVFYLSFSLFEKKSLFTLKFGDFKALIQDTQEDTHGNMSLRGGHQPDEAISFRVALFTLWGREIATPLRGSQ